VTGGRDARREGTLVFPGFGVIPEDDRQQRKGDDDTENVPGVDSHGALGAMVYRPDIHGCGDDTDDQIGKQ
jgi:hypothetical protein